MSLAHLKIIRDNMQPHERQAGVRKSVLDAAVAEFTRTMERLGLAEERNASCTCDHGDAFDVEAWLFEPSRVNPVAAAFAVNVRRVAL